MCAQTKGNNMKTQQAQHTPGPWEFSTHYDHPKDYAITAPDGQTVAIALRVFERNSMDGWTPLDKKTEANARLIAAAPDLLAACKNIQDNFDKNLTEPMRIINEAVVKAEGEQ